MTIPKCVKPGDGILNSLICKHNALHTNIQSKTFRRLNHYLPLINHDADYIYKKYINDSLNRFITYQEHLSKEYQFLFNMNIEDDSEYKPDSIQYFNPISMTAFIKNNPYFKLKRKFRRKFRNNTEARKAIYEIINNIRLTIKIINKILLEIDNELKNMYNIKTQLIKMYKYRT